MSDVELGGPRDGTPPHIGSGRFLSSFYPKIGQTLHFTGKSLRQPCKNAAISAKRVCLGLANNRLLEAIMSSDREASLVWMLLPHTSRKLFEIIARFIDDNGGASAVIPYLAMEHAGAANNSLSLSLRTLDYVGLIDIEPAPRLGRQYRLSERWMAIQSEAEIERLIAMAREIKSRSWWKRAASPEMRSPHPYHRPRRDTK